MKIIAPTFLGKHNYPNYDVMTKEIEKSDKEFQKIYTKGEK